MRIVIDVLCFFELSGDDVIDPDIAVQQMESIAYYLKRLSTEDKAEFSAFATRLALD
jgi:hypothetical protein